MDLKTRKLNLISYLAQVQDESILDKIESLISRKETKHKEMDPKPFTVTEFIDRIKKSEQDFTNGNYKTQADLEKISDNW